MSDSWAVLDTERLPWLTDDEMPRPKQRRSYPLLWALLPLGALAGAASWQVLQGDPAPGGPVQQVYSYARSDPSPASASMAERLEARNSPPATEPLVQSAAIAAPADLPRTVPPPSPAGLMDAHLALPAEAEAASEPVAATPAAEDLARLNNALAQLYSQSWSRADQGKRALLLRTQDRFVARLRDCQSAACKRSAFLDRMRQVSDISKRDWQTPQARYAADANLARLNAQLASLYSQSWSRAGAVQRTRLFLTQDAFAARLDDCASAACVNSAYVERMREVSEIMASRG